MGCSADSNVLGAADAIEFGQFRVLRAFRCVACLVSIGSLRLGWATQRTNVFQIRLSVPPSWWTAVGSTEFALREFIRLPSCLRLLGESVTMITGPLGDSSRVLYRAPSF